MANDAANPSVEETAAKGRKKAATPDSAGASGAPDAGGEGEGASGGEGEQPQPIAYVNMVRDDPRYEGPKTSIVHPDEVENMKAYDWRVADDKAPE